MNGPTNPTDAGPAPEQSEQPSTSQPTTQPTQPNSPPTSSPAAPTNAPAQPNAAAAAAPTAPTIVHPVRRTGLAGIVDEIRDALAGTTTSKVYQDANGDKYVKDENMTHGQQWRRIAGDAIRGAVAGYRQKRPGDALGAGFDAESQAIKERQDLRTKQEGQVQQQQLDKYNMIKLKHDTSAAEFALTRMKVQATENDVKFAQEQQDRERQLGSADLGVYADPGALSEVQKQDPDFWKNVYKNNIVTVPEIGPNGERKGIHVYLRTQGVGNQMVPKGTKVYQFVPGPKPTDPPSLEQRELSGPATYDQVDAWNGAAQKKYQDFQKEVGERTFKESEVVKNKAEANKANAEANKANAEAATERQTGDDVTKDISAGLAEGRYLAGKDIPLRTSKGQKGADVYAHAANVYSMQKYGLPYSPELIRQESKMAESPKVQAFLTGIDRMVGTAASPGQLDQVVDLARKAGIADSNAPWNETKLWVKERLGSEAAKNFEQALSDTQTAMGTLIGNPLLGSGESDLKLKTAQQQFGKNVTMKNLISAAKVAKEILGRSRADLAKNNRYIQQRYGDQYSPAGMAPPAPAGMVSVQIPGQPVGHIPQAALEKFKKDNPNAVVLQ